MHMSNKYLIDLGRFNITLHYLMLCSLSTIKSQTSDDCDNLSAKEETFLFREGTPELVPKKVIFTYYDIFVLIPGLNLDF